MKKILAIALALLMVVMLAACGSEGTGTPAENGDAGNENAGEQQADAGEEQNASAEDATVFDLCGLTLETIQTSVGTSLGEGLETPVQYIVPVFCGDTSAETFAKWVYELADNCRKAAKDGCIYQDEFKTEPLTEFTFDPEALINMVQFVYRVEGHVVYVTAADSGSVDNAFSCNIQVY